MRLALFIGEDSYILEPENIYVIGRGASSDIVVKNNSVSRSHCRFSINEDMDWFLEDLDSTHGTFVSNQKINSKVISKNFSGKLGGFHGVEFSVQIIKSETNSSIKKQPEESEIDFVQGPRIPLKQRVRIGRDRRNDWRIQDLEVSDFHAEINMVTAGQYEIVDLK